MKRTPLKRKAWMKRGTKPMKKRATGDKSNPYSKYWRNKADKLWSLLIRHGAKGYSERSGKRVGVDKLQAHHLINRDRYATRYDRKNGIALRAYEHTMGDGAPHGKDSWKFVEWLQRSRPETWAWMQKHQNDQTFGPFDFKAEYDRLCEEAREMGLEDLI